MVGSIQCTSSSSASTGCWPRGPRAGRPAPRGCAPSARCGRQRRAAGSARRSGSTSSAAKRRDLGRASSVARPSSASSLSSLRLGRIVAREAGRALELLDHRMERAVGVVGRAVVAERRVRLVAEPLAQRADEARLADAGLAGQQHHLALAVLGPLPAVEQHAELVLAPDQRRETAGRAAPRSGSRHAPSPATRQADTGSAKPLRRCGPRSASSNSPPTSRRVAWLITTLPGAASACSRAARFGVSPTTACSCAAPSPIRSPTTTSPVAMPTRAASGSPAGRLELGRPPSTIASPARTARSASSSCACGQPK